MMDRRYTDLCAAVIDEMKCVVECEGERDGDRPAIAAILTRETGCANAAAAMAISDPVLFVDVVCWNGACQGG